MDDVLDELDEAQKRKLIHYFLEHECPWVLFEEAYNQDTSWMPTSGGWNNQPVLVVFCYHLVLIVISSVDGVDSYKPGALADLILNNDDFEHIRQMIIDNPLTITKKKI